MCGRYTVLTENEIIELRELLKKLSLRLVRDDFSDFDDAPREVYPTASAPILAGDGEGVALESARFGFRRVDGSGAIINARVETVRTTRPFALHLASGRCVVPAGEFFEWQKVDDGKRRHYAKDREGHLLFMAGLYRNRPDPAAENGFVREFVILTREATGTLAKIHPRMPLLLRVEQIESWLTGALSPEEAQRTPHEMAVAPCEEQIEQLSLFDTENGADDDE